MSLALDTTHHQPVSQAIAAKSAGELSKDEMIAEIKRVHSTLSTEGRVAFYDYLCWQISDGRPETDPRMTSAYFQRMSHARAA